MRILSTIMGLAGIAVLAGCAQTMQPPKTAAVPLPPVPAIPVFFSPWSAALDAPARNAVATAAKTANAEPGTTILVIGAADTIGSSDANLGISKVRAQVVADQLVTDGVDRTRITTRSIGEIEAPGQTGFAQFSRRATIQIGH